MLGVLKNNMPLGYEKSKSLSSWKYWFSKCIIALKENQVKLIFTNKNINFGGKKMHKLTDKDIKYLKEAINLAKEALNSGDQPFGSVLVSKEGKVLFKDRNRVKDGDHTRHPEFEIAKWAMNNLSLEERKSATVYTSGEHCPMCAAAHGWANLGKIVYAASSKQLIKWLKEFDVKPSNVRPLPINKVIKNTIVVGPAKLLAEQVKKLHFQYYQKKNKI